jgi:hypothetical protein
MSIAPLPATLEYLSGRRFSFFPPIRNIGRNEWLYRRATWSECIVANVESGEEFSVPRVFLGEASTLDQPVGDEPATVVELHRELEWRNGSILAVERRVIELPVLVCDGDEDEAHETGRRAPVVSIRLETKPEAGKWVGVALVLGVVTCTIIAGITTQAHRRPDSGAVSRVWLELTGNDDYRTILRKLGAPARERSFERNGKTIRILAYPALRFSVVLRGRNIAEARYSETLDMRGQVLGSDRSAIPAY